VKLVEGRIVFAPKPEWSEYEFNGRTVSGCNLFLPGVRDTIVRRLFARAVLLAGAAVQRRGHIAQRSNIQMMKSSAMHGT